MSKTRVLLIAALVAAALAVVAIATYIIVKNRNAPEELNATPAASGEVFDPSKLEGAWSVTPNSVAGYRVDEVLTGQDVTVVGRTQQVEGSLTVTDGVLTETEISVDLASVATDNSNRDSAFRDLLNVNEHPAAVFTLSKPFDLAHVDEVGPHQTVRAKVEGELAVAGANSPVTATIDITVSGGTASLVGTIPITFTDFGITPPDLKFVTVEDSGVIEFSIGAGKD